MKLKETLRPYYFKAFAVGLAILAVILIFGQDLKFIIFVSVLLVISSFSTFYHNYFKSPINFEMIKFSTILISVAYGIIPGVIVGVVSTIASKIIAEKLDQTAIVSLAGIIGLAIAAGILHSENIALMGIWLVVLYHLVTAPIQLVLGGSVVYGLVYVGSNILFNVVLFTRIAPFLLRLMTG